MELTGERAQHIPQMPGRIVAIADQRLALALHPERAEPALGRGVDTEGRAVGHTDRAQMTIGIAREIDGVAVPVLDPRHLHQRGIAGGREQQELLAAAVIEAQGLARSGQPVIGRLEVPGIDMTVIANREDQSLTTRVLEQRGARLRIDQKPLRPTADPARAQQPLDPHPPG